jgi:uncharacterized membrane protein
MYSKVKVAGHPIHVMLIPFPIALYTITLLAFIVAAAGGGDFWFRVGTYANIAGVVMAGLAALPGFIDWTGTPSHSAARATGLTHMLLNVAALVLFLINAIMQGSRLSAGTHTYDAAIVLPAVGLLCTIGAGWFGWKMVQTHHVGVQLTPEQERLEPTPERPRPTPVPRTTGPLPTH